MRYTKEGLIIGLDELRRILEQAENANKYHNMCGSISITYGNTPRIVQHCQYADCNSTWYTNMAKDDRNR